MANFHRSGNRLWAALGGFSFEYLPFEDLPSKEVAAKCLPFVMARRLMNSL
jgi:hypothetical protein